MIVTWAHRNLIICKADAASSYSYLTRQATDFTYFQLQTSLLYVIILWPQYVRSAINTASKPVLALWASFKLFFLYEILSLGGEY